MKLGIFAKTYTRPTVEAVFDAVVADGFHSVHFNLSSAGLPSMPDDLDPALLPPIKTAADARGVEIETLSATFNMIHPDPAVRRKGLDRLRVLAAAAAPLGCRIVTLCTGSRNRDNMWHAHPGNSADDAWDDLIVSMTEAAAIAEEFDVQLGIEPEPGNVVSSAARARRLLDQIGSDRIGIIYDPANLIEGVAPESVAAVLEDAFDLLGDRIISAHGKDRDAAGAVAPAGKGLTPWPLVLAGLETTGFTGSLILHGLDEADIADAITHLT